jgi:hypothetical protein
VLHVPEGSPRARDQAAQPPPGAPPVP